MDASRCPGGDVVVHTDVYVISHTLSPLHRKERSNLLHNKIPLEIQGFLTHKSKPLTCGQGQQCRPHSGLFGKKDIAGSKSLEI